MSNVKEKEMVLKGSFIATLKKANGDVEVTRKDNMILNVGFDFICDALGKPSGRPNVMGYTAVGTGSTAVAASQISLVTELTRREATYSHTSGTKVFTLTTNFPAGTATGAITEAGICNAATGGTFLDRVTFAVINKAADDELTTNFQFTLS
jgi:hypothetical protein